jgi:putative heme-binding domain-containing protein
MRSRCLARFWAGLSLFTLTGVASAADPPALVAKSEARTPADERKAFHLPEGFQIQLVAAEPDIHKPLNIAFDDRGRLWVTETVEYPFAAPPGKKPRDAVKILEDFGPDGRARKITTFADELNIPIGVLPLPARNPQEAFVYSIPSIYRLSDTSNSGRADRRDALYTRFEFRDTHGMTNNFALGFDGWIYACHGFSNTSTVKGADGKPIIMNSGNTYRMKPDGSHVESFTHGQVNPFGLAFDPLGNLYSCDCHSRPIYQLLRGAWYPSFGKPHDGLGFGPEVMTHDHGSTAIAGITYYAADHFPANFQDTIFIGNVVTNRINHDRLERHGSTVRAIQLPDFLSSDDPWFRPVDIKLGPDGAIYVADFYNRIIGHYEVPLTHPGRDRERGRVWRIIWTGKDGKTPPQAPRSDWTTASVEDLVQDLGHPNLTVRIKAANQLVEHGKKCSEAVQALFKEPVKKEPSPRTWQQAHGLWVLERIGSLGEGTLTAACQSPAIPVRVHAQRVLAERPALTPGLRKLAIRALKDADANVQRAAADALGRHPNPENIRSLLDLRHQVPADDTHLLHVVRMALRDQLRVPAHWANLAKETGNEQDGKALADVALGVPTPEAAAYLVHQLQEKAIGQENLTSFVQHITRHGSPETTLALLPLVKKNLAGNFEAQANVFRAMEQGIQERGGQLEDATREWASDLTTRLLASAKTTELQAGIELAGRLRLVPHQTALANLAAKRGAPEDQRKAALDALANIDLQRNATVLGQVLNDAEAPITLREHAASVLARSTQAEPQAQLLQVLPAAPARLQTAIATGLAGNKPGAEKLLESVAAGKASARLLQERAVEVRLNQTQLPGLKARIEKLTRGLPPADQRIQDLLSRRRQGFLAAKADVTLGAMVFEKSCANCHQIGNKGARIGPQLDGIGIRGLDRLLEDTLDPNRNVDQAFRTTLLALKNGQALSGLLLKEEGEVLVMADQQGKEVRVPKDLVEERSTSQLSPMPANFAEQIQEADFYHLVAYLLSQRVANPVKPGGK